MKNLLVCTTLSLRAILSKTHSPTRTIFHGEYCKNNRFYGLLPLWRLLLSCCCLLSCFLCRCFLCGSLLSTLFTSFEIVAVNGFHLPISIKLRSRDEFCGSLSFQGLSNFKLSLGKSDCWHDFRPVKNRIREGANQEVVLPTGLSSRCSFHMKISILRRNSCWCRKHWRISYDALNHYVIHSRTNISVSIVHLRQHLWLNCAMNR